MAQTNILTREFALRIGLESTFGVAPSGSFPNVMTRTFPAGDSVLMDGLSVEQLDVNDVRTRRSDAIVPVQGLQIASKIAKLSWLLKRIPTASQLSAAGAVGSLTPRVVLTHAFGAEHAAIGTLVVASPAPAVGAFSVTAGGGLLIKKGSVIGVEVIVAAVHYIEWAYVLDVSTDAITIYPDLTAAPATGAVVRNFYCYAPAESHSNSIALDVAHVGDAAAQYSITGCHGDLTLTFPEFGKLPSMDLEIGATAFTGPSAQALSVATAADEMGAAFPFQPEVYCAASLVRGTRLVCEKVVIEQKNAWELVRDPNGVQTVAAVVNTAGRPRFAKITITTRFDSAWEVAFLARTVYKIAVIQRVDTGLTASFWGVYAPNAIIEAKPKEVRIGARLYHEVSFTLLQGNQAVLAAETGTDLDFVLGNLVLFAG